MDLVRLMEEYRQCGPETQCAAFGKQMGHLGAALSRKVSKPPASTALGGQDFRLQVAVINQAQRTLNMCEDVRLTLKRFWPIMMLLQTFNQLAEFLPELDLKPERLLAQWVMAHVTSDVPQLVKDMKRLTHEALSTHRDNLRSARAHFDQPRGSTPSEMLQIPKSYRARQDELLALIGPRRRQHDPKYAYEDALVKLSQPQESPIDAETSTPSGGTPAIALC